MFSFYLVAQEENHPYGTTLEEYNFVTKGYAVQVEQGLDMKAGYSFESGNGYDEWWGQIEMNCEDGGYVSVRLRLLINEGKDFRERAVMVIMNYLHPAAKAGQFELKYLCIPNNYSSQEIWDKYFNEIREFDNNQLLALTWVLSRSKSAEELFCFPENSFIKLANGSEKEIQYIAKGDTVSSYNFETKSVEPAIVDELLVHSNRIYELSKINISISENLTASLNNFLTPSVTLEATNNHPVFTNKGLKNFGDLVNNDKIYYYSYDLKKVILCNITSVENNIRTTQKVYNLKLINSDNFIVNGTIVKTK